jgi:hypothetical protein
MVYEAWVSVEEITCPDCFSIPADLLMRMANMTMRQSKQDLALVSPTISVLCERWELMAQNSGKCTVLYASFPVTPIKAWMNIFAAFHAL